MSAVSRFVIAFGRFWRDFLVGDTPEVFVATLVVVGLALALRHERLVAVITLPLLVLIVLAASVFRGRHRDP